MPRACTTGFTTGGVILAAFAHLDRRFGVSTCTG